MLTAISLSNYSEEVLSTAYVPAYLPSRHGTKFYLIYICAVSAIGILILISLFIGLAAERPLFVRPFVVFAVRIKCKNPLLFLLHWLFYYFLNCTKHKKTKWRGMIKDKRRSLFVLPFLFIQYEESAKTPFD